jgi:hypothetical protein
VGSIIQYERGAGQRIARFRGNIPVTILTGSEIVDFEDVLSARDVIRTAGEWRFEVKEVQPTGNNHYRAMVVVHGASAVPELASLVNPPFVRLIDARGQELTYVGSGGTSGATQANGELTFTRGTGVGEPTTLLWEVPLATREIILNFDFADLPMP